MRSLPTFMLQYIRKVWYRWWIIRVYVWFSFSVAVMLLDVGVSISCSDLAFIHSVWRSSQLVPVGLIPRIHSVVSAPTGSKLRANQQQLRNSSIDNQQLSVDGKKSVGATFQSDSSLSSFEFFGGVHVWWYKRYSLLLSKAIMFATHDLKVRYLHLQVYSTMSYGNIFSLWWNRTSWNPWLVTIRNVWT